MPELPTLTINLAQAQRLLAVFEGQVDDEGNALTPQEAYKRWLASTLRLHVLSVESQNLRDQTEANLRSQIEQLAIDIQIDPM